MSVSRYLPHARARMLERGISEADVHHALNNYDIRQDTPKNSVLYIGPGKSGGLLKVWVFPDNPDTNQPKVVKSVAWKDDRG